MLYCWTSPASVKCPSGRQHRTPMGKIIRDSRIQEDAVSIPGGVTPLRVLERERPAHANALLPTKDSAVHFDAVAASAIVQGQSREAPDEAEIQRRLVSERENASKRGYDDGLIRGKEAARLEVAAKLSQLSKLIESCATETALRLDRLDDDLIELVFVAITRILGDALMTRAGVEAAIRQVINQQRDETLPLTIRVSDRDWELLGEAGRADLGQGRSAAWIVDEKVEVGGCLIDGGRGSLDGRLETQLAKMKQALLDCHAGQRDPR